MIDIKFLRENPDIVKENIKKKFQDRKLELVDRVIELDVESRRAQTEANEFFLLKIPSLYDIILLRRFCRILTCCCGTKGDGEWVK